MINKTALLSTLGCIALSSYLIWQINQFYVIAKAENAVLGGTHAWIFDKFTYIKFDTIIERLNSAMMKKMNFILFDDEKFPTLIENIKTNIPSLANNQEFLDSIKNHTFDEFIKTLDRETQYQIFKTYNDFLQNNEKLGISSNNIEQFQKSFKALEKLHDSGIKTNWLPLCNWLLIGLCIFLIMRIPNALENISSEKKRNPWETLLDIFVPEKFHQRS